MQQYLDEFFNSELNFPQIAKKYQLDTDDLIDYARQQGYIFKVGRNKMADKHVVLYLKDAINYYLNNDVSLQYVANKFKICRPTISNMLKDMGYNIVNKQNLLRIDENIFDNIDTEEKAYWLGFIFADGCIYTNQKRNKISYRFYIGLKESDYEHLIKFNTFMKSSYNKVHIKQTNYENKRCCFWQVNNKHLFNVLNSYGCTKRKSLTLKFPNINIFSDQSLIKHFIRGYFDGDGCLSFQKTFKGKFKPRLSVLGTEDVIKWFLYYTNTIATIYPHGNDSTKDAKFNVENSWKLLHYLYDDATIYLNRKYQRYLNFINNAVTESNLRDY